jgi:hypothetical protein
MSNPRTIAGLDGLMPGSNRRRLRKAEEDEGGPLNPEKRKAILVSCFTESLRQIGGYQYVAETEVLRPLRDRTLYCLFYATRHEKSIATFRECQVNALDTQSKVRAAGKLKAQSFGSRQIEFFESLHDMGPDETAAFLTRERNQAKESVKGLSPKSPDYIRYAQLWPTVLSRHVVKLTDVNSICGKLRKKDELLFLDCEPRAKVPKDHYRIQRS